MGLSREDNYSLGVLAGEGLARNLDRQRGVHARGPPLSGLTHRLLATAMLSLLPALLFNTSNASAQALEGFAVLAGQTVTNTGPTTIIGDIGVSPGSSFPGQGSVTQTGSVYLGDAVATRIQADLTTLYNVLAGRPTSAGGNLTGLSLAGVTLAPGVYNFDTIALLGANQTLTLDGGGDPNAVFVFNIGSELIVGSGAKIVGLNGTAGSNVFYRVGSSATLNTSSELIGQIVALTSISLLTTAQLNCGAALARNGSVTLDTNTIEICDIAGVSFEDAVDDEDEGDGTSNPSENAAAVAAALDAFVQGGGVLPSGFAVLALTLSPSELADALDQLSGEIATGAAPTSFQSMDSFLDVVLGSRGAPGMLMAPQAPPPPAPPERATITVLGYGPGPTVADGSQPAFPATVAVDPRPWDIWVAAFGAYGKTDGGDPYGTYTRDANEYGVAAGLDYYVSPYTTVGIAIGKSRTSFDLDDNLGEGGSDIYQVAVHARTQYEAAYVVAAAAYGYNDVWTDRTVTVAGADRFTADYAAHSVSGALEAGYALGWITPFVGVRGQAFMAPDYSEQTVAGVSTFALNYQSHTATSLRTELGASLGWSPVLQNETLLDLNLRAAWLHEFAGDNDVDAYFQFVGPGSDFTVWGATAARDSALLSASAKLSGFGAFYVAGSVDTRLASNAYSYGGAVKVGMRW